MLFGFMVETVYTGGWQPICAPVGCSALNTALWVRGGAGGWGDGHFATAGSCEVGDAGICRVTSGGSVCAAEFRERGGGSKGR